MGELLLCNGPIAAMPFYLEGVSINIYSIEELDYYIINNVYLLDKSFMNQELCAWIENQANLKKLAEHLKMIPMAVCQHLSLKYLNIQAIAVPRRYHRFTIY